jgi:hypothetical protein
MFTTFTECVLKRDIVHTFSVQIQVSVSRQKDMYCVIHKSEKKRKPNN